MKGMIANPYKNIYFYQMENIIIIMIIIKIWIYLFFVTLFGKLIFGT